MKYIETPIPGLLLIEIEPVQDSRGFFARTWCEREFAGRGLCPGLSQGGIAFNLLRGTVRGLHFQHAPFAETKIVRCTAGSIFDVAVDLRAGAPTYLRHFAVELSARNRTALYIPEGFAHGYQTLEDNTEVSYWMAQPYVPEYAAGIRWDDPALGIAWPLDAAAISERDRNLPTLEDYVTDVRCARM
jgi:dTDP-4-dehydrorhamnose 3,5-epimerase